MKYKKGSWSSYSSWCGWPKRPNHGDVELGLLPTTAKRVQKMINGLSKSEG